MKLLLLLLAPAIMFASERTVTMKVSGNCGSCKKRIVKAAEAVDGVKDAAWDKKTKVFTAVFDDGKTDSASIAAAIVKVGHDVEASKAPDAAYTKLPDCCQYRDRTHD
ncbi:MAG TPA: ATPase [Bacteroidetes bacterium]|nr:ATPase [Bacteroidota bacterium]HRK05937.1 heavy-metal-associated domain-containing protein [Chlorobiota bacterium]